MSNNNNKDNKDKDTGKQQQNSGSKRHNEFLIDDASELAPLNEETVRDNEGEGEGPGKKPRKKGDAKEGEYTEGKDFSGEYETESKVAREIAASGSGSGSGSDGSSLQAAIDRLLPLEKKARLGDDSKTVQKTTVLIVQLCREAKDWEAMRANISLLAKRRAQFRMVQAKMVQEALPYIDEVEPHDVKLKLIETLRSVSEGKIFLEVERARLTMALAKLHEQNGDISQAAEILQEEAVETYGAMEKREKFEFMLEQVRLCLEKRDWVRANLIAQKVPKRVIDDPELEELKIKFQNLLIIYYTHEDDPLEIAKAYLVIYRCPGVSSDENEWRPVLENAAYLLACAPYDNHQIDFVHILLRDARMKKLPACKSLLERLTRSEISSWPLPEAEDIKQHALFSGMKTGNDSKMPPMPQEAETDWWKMLHERITEHNVRVVAGYYNRIHTTRLATFLQLSPEDTEAVIARMVTSDKIPLVAKIDRPSGIISFNPRKDANEHLTEWAGNISDLLSLVEKTTHLIHKENMVRQALDAKKQ